MLKSMVEKNIHFSPDICGKTARIWNYRFIISVLWISTTL